MRSLPQIFHASFASTSGNPRWWILALPQAAAFYIFKALSRVQIFSPQFVLWLAAAFIVLIPITVWLWLDMDARKSGTAAQKPLKLFIKSCRSSAGIMFCAAAVIILARLAYGDWIFFALVSSIVAATAVLAMLFSVLCQQTFGQAFSLAVDTWNKKISLAAVVAFVLILAHAVSFALVHGLGQDSKAAGEFSVLSYSAIIWVLLALLACLAAFVTAFLNCFLVFLFLETIRRTKDPEAAEKIVPQFLVSEPNP